jgi:hypothetical protein
VKRPESLGDQPGRKEHQLEEPAGHDEEHPGTRAHVEDAEEVERNTHREQGVADETEESDGSWDQPPDEEQEAEDDAADAGGHVDPQEVVGDDLRRGQEVGTAGCGDEALDDPEVRVPDREPRVDLLQHRVHEQPDRDDGDAGTRHQGDAEHHRRPTGTAVDEGLDQGRAEHGADHLHDEEDADGPRPSPSGHRGPRAGRAGCRGAGRRGHGWPSGWVGNAGWQHP